MKRLMFCLVRRTVLAGILLAVSGALSLPAQNPPARPHPQQPPVAEVPATDQDAAALQDQLLQLLRTSPNLTTVVARDPSLLADQAYVERNNPELAKFLAAHPDVARNPSYYLFSRLGPDHGDRPATLERRIWPDIDGGGRRDESWASEFSNDYGPGILFLCVLGALLWLIRLFLENRRWNRVLRLQTEMHTKLIDRFSSTQELLSYVGTDAGRHFLEASPIALDTQQTQPMPNAVARILTPLQVGIVLTLLGIGLLLLRHSLPDAAPPLLVFGTVALMPGLGFILSAGISWILAGRLGLMPPGNSGRPTGTDERL
jgi:hypothetical protein